MTFTVKTGQSFAHFLSKSFKKTTTTATTCLAAFGKLAARLKDIFSHYQHFEAHTKQEAVISNI